MSYIHFSCLITKVRYWKFWEPHNNFNFLRIWTALSYFIFKMRFCVSNKDSYMTFHDAQSSSLQN